MTDDETTEPVDEMNPDAQDRIDVAVAAANAQSAEDAEAALEATKEAEK